MICKACKREIVDNSIFCNWCGERQVKERKKKDEIKVPKPTKLPSGKWNIYLRAEGQSVTEDSEEKCIAKAKAIRAGWIEQKKVLPKLSVSDAIGKYIQSNDAILSPSTLYGYRKIQKNHFKSYQTIDINTVDWQKAINEEAKHYAPKSLQNAWGLVAKTMRFHGIQPPNVSLPAKQSKELPWLNYHQIQTFLQAIYNQSCEMAALLALHSLRRSELLAITPSKVDSQGIHVDGAKVYTEHRFVEKPTNKTKASKRIIPIMIPRLQELFASSNVKSGEPYMQQYHHTAYKQINKICEENGLPKVGYHGLRRSFASLAYHLGWSERQAMAIGGWDDWQTMHKIYIKLDESDLADAAEKMRSFYNFTDEITDES